MWRYPEVRWSARGLLVVAVALLATSACTERFQPGSRYLSCMEDAGYELVETSIGFSEATGDLIVDVEIVDPPSEEQTPEMLAQSEECILQVNGGVTATTVATTIPEGLAGEFTLCVKEAGYEVFDVEVEVSDTGGSFGFSTPDRVPEEIIQACKDQAGIP